MGRYFPEAHQRFLAALPEPDRRDGRLAAAYARLLASPDPQVRFDAAVAWCEWEEAIASLEVDAVPGVWTNPRYADADFRYGFARTVTHYLGTPPSSPTTPSSAGWTASPASPPCCATGGSTSPGPADVAWASRSAGRAPSCTSSPGVGHLGSDRMNALMVAATDRFAPL